MLRGLDNPPGPVEGCPVATRGVDVVVNVQGQGPAERDGSIGRRSRLSNAAVRNRPFFVAVEVRHPYEVEYCDVGFADVRGLARPAPAHLPVEDGASLA